MKKKIFASLLALVLLSLSLVSCAYSFEKDDLSKYATFDKSAFNATLTALVIADGTFTTDETIRQTKVSASIWADLKDLVDEDKKQTAGVVGDHDVVYYCYYCTADFGGVTSVFFASSMDMSKAISTQLGDANDDYTKALNAVLAGLDFTDAAYATTSDTEVKAKAGDRVFISYTKEYVEKIEDEKNPGTTVDSPVKKTIAYEEVTLSESDPFLSQLIGLSLATAKDSFEVEDPTLGTVTYTDAKINFVVTSGNSVGTFEHTPYTETKSFTDVMGVSRDLKDVKLTYHVFPAYYLEVPDLTLDNLLCDILGAEITSESLDIFSEEKYKTTVKDKEVTLAELVDELSSLLSARKTAKTSADDADKALEKAQTAYDKAKKTVDDAGDKVTDAMKTDLESAQTALDKAKNDKKSADEEYKNADKAAADQVTNIRACDPEMETKILDAYRKSTYDKLEKAYNSTIKQNLAKAIWKNVTANIKVTDVPEKAIRESYDAIMKNYRYTFYESEYQKGTSNYAYYNGSFENFLMAKTGTKTYQEAKDSVWSSAKEYLKPVLTMYTVAKAYDVVVSDAEYNNYLSGNALATYYQTYYGEHSVRFAHQLDKLMNYFLENEEKDGKVTYKKIAYTLEDENK